MKTRQVVIKPNSVRQVMKYLRPPLSKLSAVIYFTEKDNMPFMLHDKGGVSSNAEFRLSETWEVTQEKLDRIIIVSVEDAPHARATGGGGDD